MFLRALRVFLIVAGIATAALGFTMIAVDGKVSGGTIINVQWQCEPSDSTSGGMDCHTRGGNYGAPGGLVNLAGWASLPIGGVVLVGAAIAIGQFERPRQTAPPPAPAAATGPPPYGPGTPPQGNPPGWTGQQPPPQQPPQQQPH